MVLSGAASNTPNALLALKVWQFDPKITQSNRPYALTSHFHNNDAMLGVKTCRATRAQAGPAVCMACRGWPAGCMLGDGARDSASFDPQHAGAPFCDVICIRSIVPYGQVSSHHNFLEWKFPVVWMARMLIINYLCYPCDWKVGQLVTFACIFHGWGQLIGSIMSCAIWLWATFVVHDKYLVRLLHYASIMFYYWLSLDKLYNFEQTFQNFHYLFLSIKVTNIYLNWW